MSRLKDGLPADSPLWDVWDAIKSFYPASTANWEEEPPMMWAHVLIDLTHEQLVNGVNNLKHHRDAKGANDFPPNAGQFHDLCLTNFKWEERAHRVYEPERLLDSMTTDERKARLAAIKAGL